MTRPADTTRSPSPIDRPEARPLTDLRCVWLTDGRRCLMTGTIGTTQLRCTWHYGGLADPRGMANADSFADWLDSYREARYCSVWSHAHPVALWSWIRGLDTPHPHAYTPCRRISCAIRPLEDPRWDEHTAGPPIDIGRPPWVDRPFGRNERKGT